ALNLDESEVVYLFGKCRLGRVFRLGTGG
ncbi:MAG: hypothetical protein RL549_944, partial [Verrucomicrobiota bacterium]